jgi:hypothetical protein
LQGSGWSDKRFYEATIKFFVDCRQRNRTDSELLSTLLGAVGSQHARNRHRDGRQMGSMGKMAMAGFTLVLLATGCSNAASDVCQCPKPVAYDDATIKKITQALRDLPSDNVLHRAMDDYEDERDDLRACLAAAR